MIRFFDILFSLIGLILLSPIFVIVAIAIKIDSKGPIFYRQQRIGKNGVKFSLLKFRSMFTESDKKGLITIGNNDSRITSIGRFIRKYKIDELPQLINVLNGSMSLVGPRPEVSKYVELYNDYQRKVLSIKPGITDFASIYFKNENEILESKKNPEEYYIKYLIPQKIRLNLIYIKNYNIKTYFLIIFKTIKSVFFR
ncbi:MAG: sugar transferase [Tenuifilum sp.]|jgi:lipopolysaccharide/colanic/teichoic acid biosynthesis glycosyltransferase|uniref:sugar transferase n=1 Tax=Tenuifilum sp. TaxID=2760880 RepID=UPI0030B4427A